LLPALDGQAEIEAAPAANDELRGTETILFVDDEKFIRATAKACLERYGYTVLLAENGQVAVELFREHGSTIGAVVLDLAMPVMGGAEALPKIQSIRPDIPVVLSSGYGKSEAARLFPNSGLEHFAQKPYKARQLLEIMASALKASRGN
jgi:DNA-binding NtrC family response regulator